MIVRRLGWCTSAGIGPSASPQRPLVTSYEGPLPLANMRSSSGSALSESKSTTINIGDEDGPPRLVSSIRHRHSSHDGHAAKD